MPVPYTSSQPYLLEEAGRLALHQGLNPDRMEHVGTRILVIGGGVTGLTTSWALLDAGYSVTLVSEQWASTAHRITSQIAGALWEWPPAVCGSHINSVSLRRSKRWCMTSYQIFNKLQKMFSADLHGVRTRVANFFFDKPLEDDTEEWRKMEEIKSAEIRGFERDPMLATKVGVQTSAGILDGYKHEVPVIDTDVYMFWLRNLVASKGCQFVTARITGNLLDREDELLSFYGAHIIVNCTGLGSAELVADTTVYPLRGALIRVINDGRRFPIVKNPLVVAYDVTRRDEDGGIVFIVPRNDRILILGGIAQPHEHALDLTLESPEVRRIHERCARFVPGLAQGELDPELPLVQGLRPSRLENVCVEREMRQKKNGMCSKIIHSYGHGGSGFTLSFGCAGDILGFVKQIQAGIPPTSVQLTGV